MLGPILTLALALAALTALCVGLLALFWAALAVALDQLPSPPD